MIDTGILAPSLIRLYNALLMSGFPTIRPRRLRSCEPLRKMISQAGVSVGNLIAPLFVCEGKGVRNEIPSMPGQYQLSCDLAMQTIDRWRLKGIPAVLLFGLPSEKDEAGSQAWNPNGPVCTLTKMIKSGMSDMLVFTDVCLCGYTTHGHCGPIRDVPHVGWEVDNDAAIEGLAKTALAHANAGADFVAPSAMMDGQVKAIREALDSEGLSRTGIMAYSVKFASALYGPFRDAADSAPQQGNRKTYQMDYRSPRQARIEALGDRDEGADIIMVKPAGAYLDIIHDLRCETDLPLAAYQVSGEYSCIKAAAQKGWIDERSVVIEMVTAIRRSGAEIVITYYAEALADWL